jgi:hypothetical protein
MLTSVQSVSETMVMLMKSTGRYVYTRIYDKRYKDIYVETFKKCITAVEMSPHDCDRFKEDIIGIRNSVDLVYKPTFFDKKKKEQEYYLLACEHALDIVIKLNARFNTGTSDSEPRGYKNKGWFIPATNNIFD